jgi:hypothetical protein
VSANRKSTGVGVRPRRDRIEITLDFTPDPGLMAAAAALSVGIVRNVMTWPSYRVEELQRRGIVLIGGVSPGKHVARKAWLMKDFHFPRSPFTAGIDARVWKTTADTTLSLREIAHAIAMRFRDPIRRYSDPFSYRLLFSMLRGETPAPVDLPDRPEAYVDVGRSIRWGSTLPEMHNFESLMDGDATRTQNVPRRRRDELEERLAPPWSSDPSP